MDAPEAIKIADAEVKKLFGGDDHRLEEIESNDDGGFVVTISYHAPGASRIPIPATSGGLIPKIALGIDASRSYKQVTIDPGGKVNAVRMRQILVG